MEIDRLVTMANQIADYFKAEPDVKEGVAGTASHMRRFWDPRMRTQILAHVAAHGASGLNPIALAAVGVLAEQAKAQPVAK